MLPFTSPVSGEILWSGRGTAAAALCFISPSLKKKCRNYYTYSQNNGLSVIM